MALRARGGDPGRRIARSGTLPRFARVRCGACMVPAMRSHRGLLPCAAAIRHAVAPMRRRRLRRAGATPEAAVVAPARRAAATTAASERARSPDQIGPDGSHDHGAVRRRHERRRLDGARTSGRRSKPAAQARSTSRSPSRRRRAPIRSRRTSTASTTAARPRPHHSAHRPQRRQPADRLQLGEQRLERRQRLRVRERRLPLRRRHLHPEQQRARRVPEVHHRSGLGRGRRDASLTVPIVDYVSADKSPGGDVRNSGSNYLIDAVQAEQGEGQRPPEPAEHDRRVRLPGRDGQLGREDGAQRDGALPARQRARPLVVHARRGASRRR